MTTSDRGMLINLELLNVILVEREIVIKDYNVDISSPENTTLQGGMK